MTTEVELVGSINSDDPVRYETDDLLDGRATARTLLRAIRAIPSESSGRIGLVGPWGSGKTTVLNLAANQLSDAAIVVRFSTWAVSNDVELFGRFADALIPELKRSKVPVPRWVLAKHYVGRRLPLLRLLGGVVAVPVKWIATYCGVSMLSDWLALNVPDLRQLSDQNGWTKIGEKDLKRLTDGLQGKRVIVMIDDVDRTDPVVLPKALLALRELLDWKGFVFILALDHGVVSDALTEYSKVFGTRAGGFLDKVLDVVVLVPEPTPAMKLQFARKVFAASCACVSQAVLDQVVHAMPRNPRRLKTVARQIGVVTEAAKRHDDDAIDWTGLALFVALRVEAPVLARRVVSAFSSRPDVEDIAITYSQIFGVDTDQLNNAAGLEKLSETLTALVDDEVADVSERKRLGQSAAGLVKHWRYVTEVTIEATADLVERDPMITGRELRSLVSRCEGQWSDQLLRECVAGMAAAGLVTEQLAAEALVSGLHRLYAESISAMADGQTTESQQRNRRCATTALSGLLHIADTTGIEVLRDAVRSTESAAAAVKSVEARVDWVDDAIDRPLRVAERKLAQALIDTTSQPDALLEMLDLVDVESLGFFSRAQHEYRSEVRSALYERLIPMLLPKLRHEGFVSSVLGGGDPCATWLLQSKRSILYDHFSDKFVAAFGDPGSSTERHALQVNAIDYLGVLTTRQTMASWQPSLREWIDRLPELFKAAWLAAVATPVPFRMLGNILSTRQQLISQGMSEANLEVPPWLSERQAELSAMVEARKATVRGDDDTAVLSGD